MKRTLNVIAAVLAICAAVCWFLSAYGKFPPMLTYWDATPKTDPFYRALKFSARMNSFAAVLSGASALCIGAALFIP